MSKKPSRVIIDMDGGIDDALALILGLRSPEIEVVGITSVSGNVPVNQATINALRVVELLDRQDVWVAQGLARPIARDPIRAFSFHGRDGLGDSHLPPPKLHRSNKTALNAMIETLSSSKKHGLTIVCTGPFTNIASLLTESPDANRGIREIVIMGGAYGITEYGVGNETPVAEFNVYSDPEAAKIVFKTDVKLKAVGLDVTTNPHLELGTKDYDRIKRGRGKVAVFAARILERNVRAHGRFTLHDPMAVGVAIRPSFYKFSDYDVRIETKGEYTTGMTVADRRFWLSPARLQGNTVMVCKAVDPRFKQLFLGRLTAA
jgi:purine nucleosidase